MVSISFLVQNAYIFHFLVLLQIFIVSQLMSGAATKIKLSKLAPLIKYLIIFFHDNLLFSTAMHHKCVFRAFTMRGMKFVVILSIFSRTIIRIVLTLLMMRMITTATLHRTMDIFLVCFSYEV